MGGQSTTGMRRRKGTGTVHNLSGRWWWAPPKQKGHRRGPYDYRRQAEQALQSWLDEQRTGAGSEASQKLAEGPNSQVPREMHDGCQVVSREFVGKG